MARPSVPVTERFLSKVDASREYGPRNDCWFFDGWKTASGYPHIWSSGKDRRATHVSYELFIGPLPAGTECVRHKCDNPGCVRPDHLIPGTHKQNEQDKADRGRQLYGESRPMSKLTEPHVAEIRRLRSRGVTARDLAKRFGISVSQVYHIVNHEQWRHV